jgi:hypothetical protein
MAKESHGQPPHHFCSPEAPRAPEAGRPPVRHDQAQPIRVEHDQVRVVQGAQPDECFGDSDPEVGAADSGVTARASSAAHGRRELSPTRSMPAAGAYAGRVAAGGGAQPRVRRSSAAATRTGVVRGHHHRAATGRGVHQDVDQSFGTSLVLGRGRLVEDSQRPVGGQRPRRSDPLALTAGQRARRAVPQRGNAQHLDPAVHQNIVRGKAPCIAREHLVRTQSQCLDQAAVLPGHRHVLASQPGQAGPVQPGEVDAAYPHGARVGSLEAGQQT